MNGYDVAILSMLGLTITGLLLDMFLKLYAKLRKTLQKEIKEIGR